MMKTIKAMNASNSVETVLKIKIIVIIFCFSYSIFYAKPSSSVDRHSARIALKTSQSFFISL